MSEWREAVLGDVIELKRGYDLPKRVRADGPFPIVSSSGISGSHAEAKVQGPGVVTGRYGTLGQVFYVAGDFWPLNTSLYVRDFKGNNERFVALLLESMDLAQHDGAAAVPGLNRNQLHTVSVRVPDRADQDKIAVVAESIDHLIENTRRRVEVLEEVVKAAYREWFVRFRYPGHEGAALVDSPLGPIPEGWSIAQASDLVAAGSLEIGDGYRAKNSEMTADVSGLPFLRVANVKDGYLSLDQVDRLPRTYEDRLKSKVSHSGDTVISMKGTVGRSAYVHGMYPRLAYSPQVSFWRSLDQNLLPTEYVYCWIRGESFRSQCAAVKGATDMADYVNLGDQRRMRLLLPPPSIISRFADNVCQLLRTAAVLRSGGSRLADMRKVFLPLLVTGQIDVSSLDLDAAVEASVA